MKTLNRTILSSFVFLLALSSVASETDPVEICRDQCGVKYRACYDVARNAFLVRDEACKKERDTCALEIKDPEYCTNQYNYCLGEEKFYYEKDAAQCDTEVDACVNACGAN